MDDHHKLDWKKYELITKYIYETLGKVYKINIEGYGNDCKIMGRSGVKHQIDILTSETDGSDTYRTAIECKYWNKKVNKDTVMKLSSIIQDTGIQRGIIVSKSGFTKDAKQFADHHHILIVQLRETVREDELPQEIQVADLEFRFNIHIKRPVILSIMALDIDDHPVTLQENDQYRIFIDQGKNMTSRLFDQAMVFKDHLHEQKPFEISVKEYVFERALLHLDNASYQIKNITFTGLLTIIDDHHTRIFSLVDKVWLIMAKIFEKQTFIISENGLIIDSHIK